MCSDGAWLNGWSKPAQQRRTANPDTPSDGGAAKVKRSGNAMKQATATTCAVSSRCACVSSSRARRAHEERQRRRAASIDQYGTIVHGQNGMRALPGEDDATGTSARCAASQLAKP